MLLIAVVAWWTFAVIVWVMLIQETGQDLKYRALVICMAVFWPIVAVGVIPALVYQSCVASTARIRADLKNRGIMKEFDQWVRDRKGEIMPKDE